MPVRKRALKPDPQGRYRPCLGYRIDGKQQRFNLGMDKPEAERRMNRLYELWQENVAANGEDVWSPLALHFAKEVAKGKRRIEYPFQTHFLEADDPAAEYSQMVHVERQRFPSLDIVPTDPALYSAGVERNERLVGSSDWSVQRCSNFKIACTNSGHSLQSTTSPRSWFQEHFMKHWTPTPIMT